MIYFLLLERKRRRPALEDEEEAAAARPRNDPPVEVVADPPKKRLDTCRINGQNCYNFGQISEGSPVTPRRQAFKYVIFAFLSITKFLIDQVFLSLFSFRSYSNTRSHNRRSPTPSTRSASYHSPTRNPSQSGKLLKVMFFI